MKQQIKGYTLVFFCRGNCLNTLVYHWFCMTCFNAGKIFFLIVVLPYTCSLCLCFIQSNFKPFACFEGSGNTHLFHIALVNCVGSYPVSFFEKKQSVSGFLGFFCSILHKSPWQAFCGQIVQAYWVILSPWFVLVIGFGVFAWYGCNIFMPQLKGLSKWDYVCENTLIIHPHFTFPS